MAQNILKPVANHRLALDYAHEQTNQQTNPSDTNLSRKPSPPRPSCRSAEWSGTHHAGDPRWKELHTTGTSSAPRNTAPWSPPHSPSPPPSSLRPTKPTTPPATPAPLPSIYTRNPHHSLPRKPRSQTHCLAPSSPPRKRAPPSRSEHIPPNPTSASPSHDAYGSRCCGYRINGFQDDECEEKPAPRKHQKFGATPREQRRDGMRGNCVGRKRGAVKAGGGLLRPSLLFSPCGKNPRLCEWCCGVRFGWRKRRTRKGW